MGEGTRISRREAIAGAAVGAAAVWLPSFRVPASAADRPPGFPGEIELFKQGYENWAKAIKIDELWTCAPRDAGECARVVNWAARKGWRARPRGLMHNWSPLMINPEDSVETKVVLIDTTAGLRGLRVQSRMPAAVRVGAGETLEALLGFCEENGLGLTPVPAPGSITLGGLMAIGAHGASHPVRGEDRTHQGYGSMANLIVSFQAIVWSRRRNRYVLRWFDRDHPNAPALLVHLGRAFITRYVLRVGPHRNLRCVSRTDISASSLFGRGAGDGAFGELFSATGRIETIHFPHTDYPWTKTWSPRESKPGSSRYAAGPYNYPFSDNIPDEVDELADQIITGESGLTPLFGRTMETVASGGLTATGSRDLWGPAKNVQLFIKASTLRYDECAYAILTTRKHVQRVVAEFYEFFNGNVADYAARGLYPINGPVELRVTGLDRIRGLEIPGARPPALSAVTPDRERNWEVAVWIGVLAFPATEGRVGFYRDIDRFMYRAYRHWAEVRPEWSKSWATTLRGNWTNRRALTKRIPRAFAGEADGLGSFGWARRKLNRYDPHRVFSSDLTDRLLP